MSIDGSQVSIQSQRTIFSGQIEMSQLILSPSPEASIDVYECCMRQQRLIEQLVAEIKDLKERMIRCEYAPGGPGYMEASTEFQTISHSVKCQDGQNVVVLPVVLGMECDRCHLTDVPCESIPTSTYPDQLLCATCREHEKNLGSLSKQNEEDAQF